VTIIVQITQTKVGYVAVDTDDSSEAINITNTLNTHSRIDLLDHGFLGEESVTCKVGSLPGSSYNTRMRILKPDADNNNYGKNYYSDYKKPNK